MANANVSIPAGRQQLVSTAPFQVEDTYWGYIVRSNRRPSIGILLAQATSFFFGACFLTAAIGILVLPTIMFDGDFGVFRLGATTLFGAVAFYLLWFASRGTRSELHVDNSVGEIREVIRNKAGRPTTVACYGFDTIGGVFLDNNCQTGVANLVLRYRDSIHSVMVAEGTEAQLAGLRDRLGMDLMVVPETLRSATP